MATTVTSVPLDSYPSKHRSLSAALLKRPLLRSLALGGARRYRLPDESLGFLAAAVARSSALTSLDLSMCNLGDGPGMKALSKAIRGCKGLTHLNLSGGFCLGLGFRVSGVRVSNLFESLAWQRPLRLKAKVKAQQPLSQES